jgi:hypothetical protein
MVQVSIGNRGRYMGRISFSDIDMDIISTTRSEDLKDYLISINGEMISIDLAGRKFPKRLLQIREYVKSELGKRGML